MRLSKLTALGSLVVSNVYAEINANCSNLTAVPVLSSDTAPLSTNIPLAATASLNPTTASQSSTGLGSSDLNVTFKTLATDKPDESAYMPPMPLNQQTEFTEDLDSYSSITLTKTITIFSAVKISSVVSALSPSTIPLASIVPMVTNIPTAPRTTSLTATALSNPFTGLGLSGWNATFRTLLEDKETGTANKLAKLLNQQTEATESLVTLSETAFSKTAQAVTTLSDITVSSCDSLGSSSDTAPLVSPISSITTVPLVATVSLAATASFRSFTGYGLGGWNATLKTPIEDKLAGTVSLAATASFRSFTGYGLGGWNATLRTPIEDKLAGTANEPTKLLSQPTGLKNNLDVSPKTVHTETDQAVTTLSVVTASPCVSDSLSSSVSLASAIPFITTIPSADSASPTNIAFSETFNRLGLNSRNESPKTPLEDSVIETPNKPAKPLSQQTGPADDLVASSGTALTKTAQAVTDSSAVATSSFVSVLSFNETPLAYVVPLITTMESEASASLITTPPSKPFTRPTKILNDQTGIKDSFATRQETVPLSIATITSKSLTEFSPSGWNVTFKTLLKEKIVAGANEPAKLLSQQKGVKDSLVTPPGTASPLATPCSDDADGRVVTLAERHVNAFYPWGYPPYRAQIFPSISSPKPPCSQVGIPIQQSRVPKNFQNKLSLSLPGVQKPATATITTSVQPVHSVHSASSTTPSTITFSKNSSPSNLAVRAVTAAPSCTGSAKFTIDFDDLPSPSRDAESVNNPPIVRDRKVYFEDQYRFVSPPRDPFPPVSPPQLAVYRPKQGVSVDGSKDVNEQRVGQFGTGPLASDTAYWIDAFSLWLGCENVGPSNCVITINGFDSIHETRIVTQTVIQPPCPGLSNCKLALIEFTAGFRDLAGIQILATVDGNLVAFYLDDVTLGWSNNSCAAQEKRASGGD